MKSKKIEGVILTKWGATFIPNEEYEKKGLDRLKRDTSKSIPVGKKHISGDQIIENAVYYPEENEIRVRIKLD